MACRNTVLFLLALSAFVSLASEITADQASAAVQAWVDEGSAPGRRSAAVDSSETLSTSSGARLHVVKFSDGGFAVTPTDDRIDPVIAFVPSGQELEQSDDNPLWSLLSGDIEARERAAGVSSATSAVRRAVLCAAAPNEAVARAQARWAALLEKAAPKKAKRVLMDATPATTMPADIRVSPFVRSLWSQRTHNNYTNGDNCYNYYTPSNYVCGCVATVGAQIMHYWRWPMGSVTPQTFWCVVDGVFTNDYTMIGGTYDWGAMPDVPANGVTEAQRQAIGKLTYDVGVSVHMKWSSMGSGAITFALARRLADTFGYSSAEAAIYDSVYPYSLSELQKVVIPNCDARAPVVMSIRNLREGHAVLVDGYGYSGTDFYIHVNFGFGGDRDAWYLPPDIANYDTITELIFNVFPQDAGSIISGRVLDVAGMPIAGASVALRRGTATVTNTVTDANGIYAFVAAAGDYLVTANFGEYSATLGVALATTVGTPLASDSSYYLVAASIGNSYGNDIALTGIAAVAPPVFSPESCLFYPSTNVTITCADHDAVIRYTLDGSDPDLTSQIYAGPILVDDTVTIRARAFESGKNPSAIVGATYTYDDAAGAPKGDYFGNPINISGTSGSRVIDDNSRYTVESGEPWHTLENNRYYYQYRTVWYKWTAPGSGPMTFRTSSTGGGYLNPTYIAVYTGDVLSSIARVGFSTTRDSNYVTSLLLNVEQGTTYRIVGMMAGVRDTDDGPIYAPTGNFVLSWDGDLTVVQHETTTTPVPVPYDWLEAYYPNEPATDTARELLANDDTDGDGFTAWEEYVANTNPTNESSRLTCSIAVGAGGVPVVTVDPPVAREGFPRILQGKVDLADENENWVDLSAPSEPYRFFRVRINVGH